MRSSRSKLRKIRDVKEEADVACGIQWLENIFLSSGRCFCSLVNCAIGFAAVWILLTGFVQS